MGRYRPISYPDGPIKARYRYIRNAYWVGEHHHPVLSGLYEKSMDIHWDIAPDKALFFFFQPKSIDIFLISPGEIRKMLCGYPILSGAMSGNTIFTLFKHLNALPSFS